MSQTIQVRDFADLFSNYVTKRYKIDDISTREDSIQITIKAVDSFDETAILSQNPDTKVIYSVNSVWHIQGEDDPYDIQFVGQSVIPQLININARAIRHTLTDDVTGAGDVLSILAKASTGVYPFGGFNMDQQPIGSRERYTKISWVIITPELIDSIITFCGNHDIREVIEIGSGKGLFVALLMHPQIQKAMRERFGFATKFIATDPYFGNGHSNENFHHVEDLNAARAVRRYPNSTLMSIWPSYGSPYAYNALRLSQGPYFIYIGENEGGANATDDFFEELDKSWEVADKLPVVNWDGVHDQGTIYSRKQ